MKKADKEDIVRKMVILAKNIPGAIGEAYDGRRKLNAMVDQIEWETSRRGQRRRRSYTCSIRNFRRGRLQVGSDEPLNTKAGWPAINCRRRGPEGEKSMFPMEENEYPAIVDRYVSLKLEMVIRICYRALECRACHLSTPSTTGDNFATFEWSAGGMTHLHALLRMAHSPMIDLAAKDEESKEAEPNGNLGLVPEFAEAVAGYFENYVAGTHPLKRETGAENKVSATHTRRKADSDATQDRCATAWGDLRRLLGSGRDDSGAVFDERLQMVGQMAYFPNMHDWHEPYPGGPPIRGISHAQNSRRARSERTANILTVGNRPPGNPYRLAQWF